MQSFWERFEVRSPLFSRKLEKRRPSPISGHVPCLWLNAAIVLLGSGLRFLKNKNPPQRLLSEIFETDNTPRYHSNCAFAPLVGLQQALCTNAAHSEDVYYLCGCFWSELRCSALKYREYVFSPAPCSATKSSRKFGKRLFWSELCCSHLPSKDSGLRLGRDGHVFGETRKPESCLPAHTCRRLSEKENFPPSSSQPFIGSGAEEPRPCLFNFEVESDFTRYPAGCQEQNCKNLNSRSKKQKAPARRLFICIHKRGIRQLVTAPWKEIPSALGFEG